MMVSLEELTTLKEVGFDRMQRGLHLKTILGTNGLLYDDEIFVEFCDPFDLISAYFYYYFESGMDKGLFLSESLNRFCSFCHIATSKAEFLKIGLVLGDTLRDISIFFLNEANYIQIMKKSKRSLVELGVTSYNKIFIVQCV